MPGKRRSPGDGTFFKRSDGLWVGGVELPPGPNGKRRPKRVTARDRNVALTRFRALQADVAAGAIPSTSRTTVARWLDFWLTDILPTRDVKPATATQYERTVRLYLTPHLGAKRLSKLTPADIRHTYATVTEEISSRAAQKADQVLRLAIKAAVREGVLVGNVMDRVDKPAHIKAESSALSAATAMHLITTAMQLQGPTWAARWAFGFLTGARESEVLGLEWDRVDLDRGLVDISWQLQRLQREHGCGGACGKAKPSYCPQSKWKYPPGEHRPCVGALVFTRPKTLAGRRLIPLVPVLVQALNGLPRDSPQGLVFCRPDGKPIDQETDQKAWRDLLVTAGVPHVPQHTIRHSTATLLLEAGVDTHIVRSVIGHSDITTTQQYQHVDLGLARAAWANLAAIMPPQND